MQIRIALTIAALLAAVPCHAYVGPGLGAGVLAAIAGVVLSIGAAIFTVTYYPIKRALRRRREARAQAAKDANDEKNPEQPEISEP